MQDEYPTEGVIAKWYLGTNNLDEYREWIQRAFDKQPENGFVQVEYAAFMLRNEDFEQAIKVIGAFEQRTTFRFCGRWANTVRYDRRDSSHAT